jgi:hypothetical protein
MKTKIKKPKWSFQYWPSYQFNLLPKFNKHGLYWKDKFGTPRCEIPPTIEINWLWFSFWWRQGDDDFWEQWLWLTEYCDNDIEEAKETWPWVSMENKESTWKDFKDLN